jgi:hypothetical protein
LPPSRSAEELGGYPSTGLRPLPTSRDDNPYTHARKISGVIPNPHTSSRDASPLGGNRIRSEVLRVATSYPNLPERSTPKSSIPPFKPSSAGVPALNDLATHDIPDQPLLPPPPIRASFAERAASPTGSRASTDSRGRPESPAGDGSRGGSRAGSRARSPGDALRPSTPTEGKLLKKRSWIPGKGHGRSTSGMGFGQGTQSAVFVVSPRGRQPYDASPLLSSRQVRERSVGSFQTS